MRRECRRRAQLRRRRSVVHRLRRRPNRRLHGADEGLPIFHLIDQLDYNFIRLNCLILFCEISVGLWPSSFQN